MQKRQKKMQLESPPCADTDADMDANRQPSGKKGRLPQGQRDKSQIKRTNGKGSHSKVSCQQTCTSRVGGWLWQQGGQKCPPSPTPPTAGGGWQVEGLHCLKRSQHRRRRTPLGGGEEGPVVQLAGEEAVVHPVDGVHAGVRGCF